MSGSMSKSDQSVVRQFSIMIGALAVLTVILIFIALAIHQNEPKETNPNVPARTAVRIAPAGAVYAGDTGRAAMQAAADAANKAAASQVAYGGATDGKEIFDHLCTSCHTSGVAGAPKVGDKPAWGPRLAAGIDTVIKHAIEGYHGPDGNFMPPKGGNPALTAEQVTNAVHWMADQSK